MTKCVIPWLTDVIKAQAFDPFSSTQSKAGAALLLEILSHTIHVQNKPPDIPQAIRDAAQAIALAFERSMRGLILPFLRFPCRDDRSLQWLHQQLLLLLKLLGNLYFFRKVLSPRVIVALAWRTCLLKAKAVFVAILGDPSTSSTTSISVEAVSHGLLIVSGIYFYLFLIVIVE